MYRKFASLKTDQQAYSYDSSQWSSSNSYSVKPEFRAFDVLGDGLTQHSPDWPVQIDHLADYLYSLAAALIKERDFPALTREGEERQDEFVRTVASFMGGRGVSDEALEFAAGLVFKDSDHSKPRYYSVRERKVFGRIKEYDKRYTRIEEWVNGTPDSILRLVTPEYSRLFDRLLIARDVYRWVQKQAKRHMDIAPIHLKLFGEDRWKEGVYDKAHELDNALDAVEELVAAFRQNLRGTGLVDNYRRNLSRDRQEEIDRKAKENEEQYARDREEAEAREEHDHKVFEGGDTNGD